jgi:hypothetical protein
MASNGNMIGVICKCSIKSDHFEIYANIDKLRKEVSHDALPSPGVNPLEGSPKYSCGKLGFGRCSRLPTLERGRGLSWEPKD